MRKAEQLAGVKLSVVNRNGVLNTEAVYSTMTSFIHPSRQNHYVDVRMYRLQYHLISTVNVSSVFSPFLWIKKGDLL